MTGTRLAIGLFSFQIPTFVVAVGGVIITGGSLDFAPWFLVPLSVVMLLGSLITWGIESWRPLPPERRGRRMVRYQLPTFILFQLPALGYAFIAGALFHPRFSWEDALPVYGIGLGGYLLLVALPLVFLSLKGAVTPPPRR